MLTNDTIDLVKMHGPFSTKNEAFERCLKHVDSWYTGTESLNTLFEDRVYLSMADEENDLYFSVEDYNYDIYKLVEHF